MMIDNLNSREYFFYYKRHRQNFICCALNKIDSSLNLFDTSSVKIEIFINT